jgi:CTP:molybdopterin cytidylyltransferase MocA
MPTAKKKPAKSAKKAPSARPASATRGARSADSKRKERAKAPPKPRWSEQYEKAVGEYSRALQQVHRRNWVEARALLQEVVSRYAEEADLLDITDRARSYLRICERHLNDSTPTESDPFLVGVYHGNRGEYDDALRMFEQALQADPDSDKILYAIAAARSQKGEREGAIESLKRSISLDDRNRVYALNDADFDPIRDEPEFIDLVEPEEALHVLILAAGLGKRMKSTRIKLLHEVAGRAMIDYVLEATERLGATRRLIVLGNQAESLRERLPAERFEVVLQNRQRGTGHAVLQAEKVLARAGGNLLVLNGDLPGIQATTLRRFVAAHRRAGAAASLMTAVLDDPSGYGRILRDPRGNFERIVEHSRASSCAPCLTPMPGRCWASTRGRSLRRRDTGSMRAGSPP